MQLAHGTIIAVADGAKLNLYRNGGSDGEPRLTAIGSPDVGDRTTNAGSRHHGGSVLVLAAWAFRASSLPKARPRWAGRGRPDRHGVRSPTS